MIRINREFCLTDNSVNCYGYRLLTEGLEIDKFRPPVGYFMHDRDRGVALTWTDFRVEGDALFATPIVNDTLFPDLAKQIEDGFIAAASVGHIVALELSDDADDKLPGQTGPTVKRWYPREVSLVDIPGNPNALARLFDEKGSVLRDLSAQLTKQSSLNTHDMDIRKLFPDLTCDADNEQEVIAYVQDLRERATRCDQAEQQLAELESRQRQTAVGQIIATALADHRIEQNVASQLATDYADRPDALQKLVDMMPARKKVPTPQPREGQAETDLAWDELDRRGLLPRLKAENPDLFKKKFHDRFGTDWAE